MEEDFGACRAVAEGPQAEGRLRALSVVLAPPPRSSPRGCTAGPGRESGPGVGWERRGSRGAGHRNVSLAPVRLQAQVCSPRGSCARFPRLQILRQKGEEKEILATTRATRALKKVLDADPGTNREMGTRTNATGMRTSSFCFLFHVPCRQRSSTCESALVLSLLQSTEHLPIVPQNRPFLSPLQFKNRKRGGKW